MKLLNDFWPLFQLIVFITRGSLLRFISNNVIPALFWVQQVSFLLVSLSACTILKTYKVSEGIFLLYDFLASVNIKDENRFVIIVFFFFFHTMEVNQNFLVTKIPVLCS